MNWRALRVLGQAPSPLTLGEAVLHGLARRPRCIEPKFFYDEHGSRLFDAICDLPEYYLTRTEMDILESCAAEIAQLTGPDCTLIELGSGASRKIRLLLDALRPRHYVGVDISHEFLLKSLQQLARDYPWLEMKALCADFAQEISLPDDLGTANRLVFFPGSTIGNFEPHEALAFLQRVRRLIQQGGALVIGVDLKKEIQLLQAAYNDEQGITARFNLNLLARLRTELAADVDLDGFRHWAFYNPEPGRIEMHLVSRRRQTLRVLDREFEFLPDETIQTENSYKYSVEQFQSLARRAGLRPVRAWLDRAKLFSVHYLRVASAHPLDRTHRLERSWLLNRRRA